MCGIVGVVGDIVHKHEKAFKDLLIIDSIRGPHSTGVLSVKRDGDMAIAKSALLPQEFMDTKKFTQLMARNHKALIGHNRYATKGKINTMNAHPFVHGTTGGVHNGTLRGQHRLPDWTMFDVDSDNIIHSLEVEGVDNTIPLLDGAYALVWYEEKDQLFHMIRNKERPLVFCYADDMKTLWFASESWMLSGALGRHGINHDVIYHVTEDMLHTLDLSQIKPQKKLEKLKTKARQGYLHPIKKRHAGTKAKGTGGMVVKKTTNMSDSKPLVTNYTCPAGLVIKLGDTLRFFVDDAEFTDREKTTLRVECSLTRAISQKCWVYLSKTHPLFNHVKNYQTEFSARVVSMFYDPTKQNTFGAMNIVMNPSTMEVVDEGGKKGENKDLDINGVKILGMNGEEVTEKKFKEDTIAGCAWCGERPHTYESAGLIWLDNCREFVCRGCADDDECAKPYLSEVNPLMLEH